MEGIDNLRWEKGYAVTDERHRLTLYGEAQLPWRFSLAPIYTFGSGVAADTFLPGTGNINGASGSRLPLLPRNAIGREVKEQQPAERGHRSLECVTAVSRRLPVPGRRHARKRTRGHQFLQPIQFARSAAEEGLPPGRACQRSA